MRARPDVGEPKPSFAEPRRRPWLARACGAALALAAFEGVIRPVYTVSSVDEPGYGMINAPDRVIRWSREGHAVSRWTAHGIRGVAPRNAHEPHVVVLGDSFTEGIQVDDEEVYPALVEQALRDRGIALAVWNAGRSSASVADYVAFAPRHLEKLTPQWTAVQIGDDDLCADAWSPQKTHFSGGDPLEVTKVLPERRGRLGALAWTYRQRLMLVGYAFVRFGEFRRAADEEPALFRAGNARAVEPVDACDHPVERELDALFGAYGGRMTLLYLSSFDPRDLTTPSAVEARALAHCVRRGYSCVSTRSGFAQLLASGLSPYGHPNTTWNVGHMNAAGHRLAAERLTSEVVRLRSDGLL